MMFDVSIVWKIAGTDPLLTSYFTRAQVSAPDEIAAEEIVRREFAACLKGFASVNVPVVEFNKIELSRAASDLTLMSGYGA